MTHTVLGSGSSTVFVFFIEELLNGGSEFPLKFVLHPPLLDQLYHLSCLPCVLASYNVALSKSLILSEGQIAKVPDGRGHNNQTSPI